MFPTASIGISQAVSQTVLQKLTTISQAVQTDGATAGDVEEVKASQRTGQKLTDPKQQQNP